jgi:predicted small lipoprotein YifL
MVRHELARQRVNPLARVIAAISPLRFDLLRWLRRRSPERPLALDRLGVPFALAVLLATAALGLSACGRKGPLDPPSAATAAPPLPAPPGDASGAPPPAAAAATPAAQPAQKKSFLLDPLLQ